MPIILNDITPKNAPLVLPLNNLVAQLRQNGFIIRPDDYIEMLKVVEKFGSENLEDLAPRFCPLIATSPEEQERFYKVFEEYKTQPVPEVEPPFQRWWKRIKEHLSRYKNYWLLGTGSLLLAVIFYFITKPSPLRITASFTITKLSYGDTVYRVGDTLLLDATTAFQSNTTLKEAQFLWNTGNGFVEGAPAIKTILQKEGEFTAQLKVHSSGHAVKDSTFSITLPVCPRVTIPPLSHETQYTVGQTLELNVGTFKKDNNFQQVYWKVNGNKYQAPSGGDAALHLPFDSAGIYQVSLIGLYNEANNESAPCSFIYPLEDIVVSEGKTYTLNTTYYGQDVTRSLTKEVSPWLNWLLILTTIATTLWTLAWWLRRNKKEEAGLDESLNFTGKKPPYETPFENRDDQLIQPEPEFRKIYHHFRQKAEDETIAFNVPKSIYSTIRTGGVPELVFTSKLRYNDYLVLIDATHAKGMQVHLFDYLVQLLNEEAICVERYYYAGGFEKVWNENAPEGMSLRRMSERYKNYTLIIMGSGHQLVYESYPVLEKNLTATLNEWEHKAILTPIPYKDWGKKEQLIAQQFVLLPADIAGQLKLIEAIRERQLNQDKYLSSINGFYKASGYDFEEVDELEAYLGDEVLFQWLCATAVFHKLRWEILVEVGKVICAQYNEPEKMNFTSLLKLSRISWMAEGNFPAETRLEILKRLKPENEVLARETLLRMMQYADTYFGQGYVFDEEKEIQKITSRFLLYANSPSQFSDYKDDSEKFKSLWETDHLWDMPQKTYLDNDTPAHWPSLLHHGNKNIGLKEYFNLLTWNETNANRKVLWRNGMVAACFLIVLGLLHLFKDRLPSGSVFISSSTPASALFTIAVNGNIACEEANAIQTVTGALTTPDGVQHPLSFKRGTLANDTQQYYLTSLRLPVTNDDSKSLLQLSWNENEGSNAVYPVQLNYDKLQTAISACIPDKRYNVTVYYNDSLNRNEAIRYATILTDAGYHIDSILYEQFTDSSHIDYFNRTDKAIADTMASLLSVYNQQFGTTGYTTVLNNNTGNYRKQFDVIINLAKEIQATPARLPSSLTEIWRGASNNRLITIDVVRKVIYYSTGGKRTYGTYGIEEVWRLPNDVYQLITRADKQYAVFMLKNVRPASFELAVCQNRYNTKEEAKTIDESGCGPFNPMNYYIDRDPDRIYFNFGKSTLPANQKNKLSKYIINRINNNRDVSVSVTLSSNRFYSSILRLTPSIYDDLDKAGLQREEYTVGKYNSFPGTPFDRDYLQLQVMRLAPPKQRTPQQQKKMPNEPVQYQKGETGY